MDEELIWMAGFFDGEGCISMVRCGPRHEGYSPYYRIVIAMTLTNEAILRLFHARFGGRFYPMHNGKPGKSRDWKPQWQWRMDASPGARFIEEILPYLKLKHEQAEKALLFWRKRDKNGNRRRKTQEELAYEEQEWREFKELKATQ